MRDVTGYRTNVTAHQHRGGVIPCFQTVHNTLKPSCRRTTRVADRAPIVPRDSHIYSSFGIARRAVEYYCHYNFHLSLSEYFARRSRWRFEIVRFLFVFHIFSQIIFFSTTVQQTRRPPLQWKSTRTGRCWRWGPDTSSGSKTGPNWKKRTGSARKTIWARRRSAGPKRSRSSGGWSKVKRDWWEENGEKRINSGKRAG